MDERDRIFEEEQRHLTETYAFLRTKEQSVADELRTLYEKARQELYREFGMIDDEK